MKVHLALDFYDLLILDSQNYELAIKGKFDAVLDTIGVPDTERMGISFLRRGGHYMTLQVEHLGLLLFFVFTILVRSLF